MKKFSLFMEPALPRTDTDLIKFIKEQMQKPTVDKGLLSSILDSFPYAILVFNEHSRIVYVNEQFAQLVGASAEELLDLDIRNFAERYVKTKPYDFSRLPRILAGETITGYHYDINKGDGTTQTVEFNSYPLYDDRESKKTAGCLILIREKSKEAEETEKAEGTTEAAEGKGVK